LNLETVDPLNRKAKGVYQLLFSLPVPRKVKVGRKGVFDFPKGYYVYTGSAKNSLKSRIRRHLKKNKNKFWHIDYLLPYAKIKDIVIRSQKSECYWNNKLFELAEPEILVNGFGSSDCKCTAHLLYFRRKPELNSLKGSDKI
jgi:sugar fermentation stimulation protein A